MTLVGVVTVALVLAAIVGGLSRVHSQSAGYERAVDRSFAAQARPVVAASNHLARRFRALLAAMPGDSRTSLEFTLDTLVRQSASLATEARTAATPAPSGGAGSDLTVAMADRADAIGILRTAVDRLLGMNPLPVAGAPDPSRAGSTPRPLTAPGAAARLARVGSLLARSDRVYAAGRRALLGAPGRAVLPPSVWSVRTVTWTSTGTLAMADALAGSATLAAVLRVELVPHTLALTPAPVPGSGAAATRGISLLPPTGRVGISVVVANDGNVAERDVVVRASVRETVTRPPGTTTPATARPGRPRRLSLTAKTSVAVTLPPVPVVPGHRYTVVVTLSPPLPDAPGTPTSDSVSVRVAPPGPPTVGQLLPAKGSEKGGADVTILGSGFTWVGAVTFGATRARFKVVSSTQITAIAPAGTGTVDVHVTNPGGTSATSSADRFVYRRK
jgi:hypothetical protein